MGLAIRQNSFSNKMQHNRNISTRNTHIINPFNLSNILIPIIKFMASVDIRSYLILISLRLRMIRQQYADPWARPLRLRGPRLRPLPRPLPVKAAVSGRHWINDFNKAWELLKQAGASNNIDYLNSIEAEITIAEGDINSEGPNNFIPKNNTIYWLPKYGIITDNLYFLSPMENLQHEADHGAKYNSDPTTMLKDGEVSDPAFGNREERRVILGSETETAQKLGKLKEGEITRSSHTGVYIKVADVNSTFVDSEFIVTVTDVGSLPKLTPSKIVFPTPSIRMPTTIKINQ